MSEEQAKQAIAAAIKSLNAYNASHSGNFSGFDIAALSKQTFGSAVQLPTAAAAGVSAQGITTMNTCAPGR